MTLEEWLLKFIEPRKKKKERKKGERKDTSAER